MKTILKSILLFSFVISFPLVYAQEKQVSSNLNHDKAVSTKSNLQKPVKINKKKGNDKVFQNDFLYHQNELVNLQTTNSLLQKDLRFALFHRFLPDVTGRNSYPDSQDLGTSRGVSAGFELSFGISDDLDIGTQYTTRNKTNNIWLQYSLFKEVEMKNYLYRRAGFLSMSLRLGYNKERGNITNSNASITESGMSNNSNGSGKGSSNKKNAIFTQLIMEKMLSSYMRIYLVPGFISKEHSDFGGDAAASLGLGSYFTPFGLASAYRFSLEYHLPLMGANGNAHSWATAVYYVTSRHTFAISLSNSTGTTFDHYILAKEYNEVHLGFQFSRNFSPFL